MSFFNNIFFKGIVNLLPNVKPSTTNYGRVYMKADNLLYYLNPAGDEYLLSTTLVINTMDFLLAENTTFDLLSPYIPWNSSVVVQDNVSINTDTSIINIGTAGTYNVKYTIFIENTDNSATGSNPRINSYIALNGGDGNGFRRYGTNTESIVVYNGNYVYAVTVQSVIVCTTNSSIRVRAEQFSGSSTAVMGTDISEYGRLNVQRVFPPVIVGSYLSARFIGQQVLTSASTYDILWNTVNNQIGDLSVSSGDNTIVNVESTGYYNITYDVVISGDSNDITTDPIIEAHIQTNDGTFRTGSLKERLVTTNGNVEYYKSISSIGRYTGGDELKFRVTQTTGSNTIKFSGLNDATTDGVFKITNLNAYKMIATNSLILRRNTNVVLTDNTLTAISWNSEVDKNGDITWGGTQISIATTGTYDVSYTVRLNNTDNTIDGLDPRVISFIAIDGLTAGKRYGLHQKSVITNDGNIDYIYTTTSQIEIIAGSFIELYINQITGTTINASSATDSEMMDITIVHTLQ